MVTAYGFTLLTGRGAQILIGAMLILTVPLRYAMRAARPYWATADWCSAPQVMAR